MNAPTHIELQESTDNPGKDVQLPLNILRLGEIDPDDVKVYIKQDVYKVLEKYACEDVDHECGTMLLGNYHESLGKTHVIISNYVEAKYTDASASSLTFTHETWEYVHQIQAKKFSDKRIVGWQHTHPGYGVFLSNYDIFIQENFFNLAFQVAYVIDPIQRIRGFFQWKNEKIEKLKGFYIYDEMGKPIKIENDIAPDEDKKNSKKKGLLWITIVTTVLAICVAVGCLFKISDLKQQLYWQQQEKNIQEKNISTEKKEDIYLQYIVQSGETLETICDSQGIDYWQNRVQILKMNGIGDENTIHPGRILVFDRKMIIE